MNNLSQSQPIEEWNDPIAKFGKDETGKTKWFRYFGFGGRILAVPMTLPNYFWVRPWRGQKDLTPQKFKS